MRKVFREFGLAIMLAMVLAGCGGGSASPEAVTVTSQPSSTNVVAGSTATFNVVATGDGLVYQWQISTDGVSWADISDATASTYSIAAASLAATGNLYRVVISGKVNSVTSSVATLTVTGVAAPPLIVAQPADQVAIAGADVSFAVTASGTALTYQWQSTPDGTSWTDVAGATNATLFVPAVAVGDSGKHFRVVVSNDIGSLVSTSALLTVMAASTGPAIVTQPVSVSVIAPQAATFTVVATGSAPLSYQWQASADSGATYTDVAGAVDASLTTPATTLADNGKLFRVRVLNEVATVVSAAATLGVTELAQAPTIVAQPVSQTVSAPLSATFTISVTGSPSPTFQWQVSTDGGATFSNINGATNASYATPATTSADNGKQFRVVVSNAIGTVQSGVATLTIVTTTLGGFPSGVVLNSSGTLYVAEDVAFSGIQQVDPTTGATVSLAGSTFGGLIDGAGSSARFPAPEGIALDSAGNLYIADYHAIRMMTPTGVVTTIAGGASEGFRDGAGTAALFATPSDVAVGADGTIYVADSGNNAIRVISTGNVVTTLSLHTSNGSPTTLNVTGIVVDVSGNLHVAADDLYVVSPTGLVTPFASGTNAYDLVSDGAGGFYATGRNVILRISASGVVTTLAGTGAPGFVDGAAGSAQFNGPVGLTVDGSGNVFVADTLNKAIRKVTPSGYVSTIAH